MVELYTDDRMLDHVPNPGHPEKPERLRTILRELKRSGMLDRFPSHPARLATDAELLRVHTPAHLADITRQVAAGGGQVEEDTWISPLSEVAARLAAGAAVDAVDSVIAGKTRRALCLVRPPGHHALPDRPMGFCLYGNVAVAAADAVHRLGLDRVLIVDWDVHHGNGTQDIFYEDPRVAFFSIHRHPFYPGTGLGDETGTARGLGTTKNVPLRAGIERRHYLDAFRTQLQTFADAMKPQLVLISAGFDAHAEDPVGNLGLETEDFAVMTRDVIEVANQHAGGRLVSVLEGGYNVSRLAGCVMAHLEGLGDHA
ncbi:histone deacetylase family protein [Tundrisphaera sp. TA3]|uniref:histone deacetylase family protein n=1 Tax=Tundrisphaera sp. TA3 TaxID=3435775 RepID=UPI003EBBA916